MKGRSYEVLPTEGGNNNDNSELSSQRGGTLSETPRTTHKVRGNRSRNRGEGARTRRSSTFRGGVNGKRRAGLTLIIGFQLPHKGQCW